MIAQPEVSNELDRLTKPGPKTHTSNKKWTNKENNAIAAAFSKEICSKCLVTPVSLKKHTNVFHVGMDGLSHKLDQRFQKI